MVHWKDGNITATGKIAMVTWQRHVPISARSDDDDNDNDDDNNNDVP